MTTLSDDALQTLQREIHGLLGRCLLRLQQYERLIKAIVAHHEISGSPQDLEAIRAARANMTARKMLGQVVGEFLGSYIVNNQVDTSPKIDSPEEGNWVSHRVYLGFSEEDFIRIESELKELVLLRNNLVHHFIDQHNLASLDGCHNAQVALVAAYSRIDQHFEQLREWAEHMEQSRQLAAALVQSDEFQNLVVNGNAPDGTVDWVAVGIVRALREAAGELAVDGWVSIAEAGRWISERFPEQVPAKYGCSSWRQVVHESRAFEIRYFERDGQRSAWYRGK